MRAAIGWPRVGVQAAGETPLRLAPAAPPPVLAIVAGTTTPPVQHAAGAAALRAASRLTTRHSSLRVLLLGASPELQSMRVHAGSVGLADRLTIIPLDALITPGPFDAAAVWVTAQGDEGAVSIVSAMMRRIPVIVPRGFDTEVLVAPRITGFVADDGDLAGSVAALAHVLVDANEHHAMGAAAAARAARLHNWDASLDRTLEALARVSGSRTSRPDAAPHHNHVFTAAQLCFHKGRGVVHTRNAPCADGYVLLLRMHGDRRETERAGGGNDGGECGNSAHGETP